MKSAPPRTPGPGAESSSFAEIKRQSVRGGSITILAQVATAAINLTSTVFLARILTPAEYGVMAMAATVTAFAGLFLDLGLSSATIQSRELTHHQLSNLYWINLAFGSVLTLLVASLSPLVAKFFQRPELVWVTAAVSLNFVIGSFSAQQSAWLIRQMRFGRRTALTLTGSAASLGVSVILALRGYGYWSLVYGGLTGALVTAVLLNLFSGWRPGAPSRHAKVKSLVHFGANTTAFEFVNYFARNLDNIVVGRFWGPEALGLYGRAYNLLLFPITNLRGPINAVAFPALSRLQNQPDEFRAYFLRTAGLLAFVSMPLTAFLFAAADPLIEFTLGPRWEGVVPIFAVLAWVGFIQPVVSLWGMVVQSSGRSRLYLKIGVFNAVCCGAAFLGGVPWGGIGVAAGYAVVNYVTAYPILKWAFQNTSISFGDFVGAIEKPAAASIVAVLALLVVMPALLPIEFLVVKLTAMFGVYAAVYLAAFFAFPGRRLEFDRLARLITHVRRPVAAKSVPSV